MLHVWFDFFFPFIIVVVSVSVFFSPLLHTLLYQIQK